MAPPRDRPDAPVATADADPQTMILKNLKHATRTRHAALEQRLPLLDPDLSRATYRHLLQRFLGYYAPLEQQLARFDAWPATGLVYTDRRKTPRLQQDLLALGATVGALERLPGCRGLPDVADAAQVLGCLYVIEGATLGGQIITRHLSASLGLAPASGASFFDGYGAQTGPRWREFGVALTAAASRLDQDARIIASANATFETMEDWLFADAASVAPIHHHHHPHADAPSTPTR